MAQAQEQAYQAFCAASTRDEKLAAVRQFADAYNLDFASIWADFVGALAAWKEGER